MIFKARIATEANLTIAFAAFLALLVAPELAEGGVSTAFAVVFIGVQMLWIAANLRHSRVRLDGKHLVINDYFRKRVVNTSEILHFDTIVGPRGLGHTRRMLEVQLRSGDNRVFRCVHDSPRSQRLVTIVAEMNRFIKRYC